MHVVFVAAEVAPDAKVGGLADVVGALPPALARLGLEVTVIVPRHQSVDRGGLEDTGHRVTVDFPTGAHQARLLSREQGGVRQVFLDSPELYDREGIYGTSAGDHPDNALRFAFLCRAAIAAVDALGAPADVWHLHDWHTALVPVLLGAEGRTAPAPALLTLHNAGYQGRVPWDVVDALGLPPEDLAPGRDPGGETVRLLEAGVAAADRVSTVSEGYAKEILSPEASGALAPRLARLAGEGRLTGIVNGIDTGAWDPAKDPAVAAPYDADHPEGKASAKQALQRELGLPVDVAIPLCVFVGRLVEQKGADLLAEALPNLVRLPAQVAVLGSGEARFEAPLSTLHDPASGVSVRIAFDEALAHRMTAGADLFLMPSRFEPCGLGQLHAMRYGTVPVVTPVGGLAETVRDLDQDADGTGFVLASAGAADLVTAVRRAVVARADGERWAEVVRRLLSLELGWDAPARRYERLYREIG